MQEINAGGAAWRLKFAAADLASFDQKLYKPWKSERWFTGSNPATPSLSHMPRMYKVTGFLALLFIC